MSAADITHNQALNLVEQAIQERSQGNAEKTRELYAAALDLEVAAIAELAAQDIPGEPTWSLLHRSAGWMAVNSGQFQRAKQLAAAALAGNPPPELAAQLDELMTLAIHRESLRRNGLSLGENAMQLSLSGDEVGPGIVEPAAVYGRVNIISKMIYRIAERKLEKKFRTSGRPTKDIQDSYRTLVGVPASGSFALTLRWGQPTQQTLFTPADSVAVLDEFLDIVELSNRAGVVELEERIPDPAYLRSLYIAAKSIAPDGRRIRRVSFNANRAGAERAVVFTRPGWEFEPLPMDAELAAAAETFELRGKLLCADATAVRSDKIKIVDADGKSHTLTVLDGKLNDIVSAMWDTNVTAQCLAKGSSTLLLDIDPDTRSEEYGPPP